MKAHRGRSQVILEALRRDLNERRRGLLRSIAPEADSFIWKNREDTLQ